MLTISAVVGTVYPDTESYEFILGWGNDRDADGNFYSPSGVAVDSAGNIYVADENNNRIQKFSPHGKFLKKWGTEGRGDGQLIEPVDLTVDIAGYVYVIDRYNCRVQKFDSEGIFIKKWGSRGKEDGQFDLTTGIDVDIFGNIYIADESSHRVQKFDSEGKFKSRLGIDLTGEGYFDQPKGIVVDDSGYIYVCDVHNHRIQVFDSEGNYIRQIGEYKKDWYPRYAVMDVLGNLYISDDFGIRKLDRTDGLIKQWQTIADTSEGHSSPSEGMAMDRNGNLYIADFWRHRVLKFDSKGNFLKKWGTKGKDDGQFEHPNGIAVDGQGNVYVIDSHNSDRIQKFSSEGKFIMKWNADRFTNFGQPLNIVIDKSDNIYVRFSDYTLRKFNTEARLISETKLEREMYSQEMAIDGKGNVYFSCEHLNTVKKIAIGDSVAKRIGLENEGKQFKSPADVATDESGNVYVLDIKSSTEYSVKKFNPDGSFKNKWMVKQETNFYARTLALDKSRNVYIGGSNIILKYDSEGNFMREIIPSESCQIWGMDIDASENIFIADIMNDMVRKLDLNGKVILKWGTNTKSDGKFSRPCGITSDCSGNIYVLDGGNSRVQKFNSKGDFLTKWGSSIAIDDEVGYGFIRSVVSMATDYCDNVYVLDSKENKVVMFNPEGNHVKTFSILEKSNDIYGNYVNEVFIDIEVDNSSNIYVLDKENERVKKYDSDGKLIKKFGNAGSGNGKFYGINGIAIDKSGNIYVADRDNFRIQKFDTDCQFICKFGKKGSGDGEFLAIGDVAADTMGYVYISDRQLNRIQKYDSNGMFIMQIGSKGSQDGQLIRPGKICIDTASNLYVMDEGNRRIQKFSPEGKYLMGWESDGFGIVADKSGHIYIYGSEKRTIKKISSTGENIAEWERTYDRGRGRFSNPNGIAVDKNGNVFVTDCSPGSINKFSPDGKVISRWSDEWWKKKGYKKFYLSADGITIDKSGNIYVADDDRIVKLNSQGNVLKKWGQMGEGIGEFNFFYGGIAISPSEEIYVADGDNYRIQVFTLEGKFLRMIGEKGAKDGQFCHQPINIAVDKSGNVFVAETLCKIQKFSPDGKFLTKWTNKYKCGHTNNSIAVDDSGDIYICDEESGHVEKFSRSK